MSNVAVLNPTPEGQMSAGRTFENITAQELALAEEMGVELTGTINQRMDNAINRTNTALQLLVEAGLVLISVKAECEHGQFGKLLEDRGLSRQRASEMMKMAAFSAELPAADRKKVLTLPKKKALLLATTDPEVVAEVLDSDEQFDDITQLNYQAMRDQIRQLEADNANLATDLDTERTNKEQLTARLKKERATSPLPDFVVVTRHEANAMSEQALINIDGLSQLAGDLIGQYNAAGDKSDEYERYLQMSATTLSTHLAALIAKANSTLNLLRHNLPSELIIPISGDLLYSDSELEDAIMDRADLVREHEQQRQIRANEREMSKPRGPGRPKKTD